MIQFASDTLGWRFLLALVLSATLWARLTLEQNPARQDVYPSDITVEARGMPASLVIANDIPPIRVKIAAPQESWKHLGVGSFRAVVDLSSAHSGLSQPAVQVEVSDPDVRVLEAIPSKVSVRIEEVRSKRLAVRLDQLGSLPFGFRLTAEPSSTPPYVEISGPSSAVEKVGEVVVAVRMEEIKATVERTLKPEPRGSGGVVTGVRVEPQSVTVTVPVEQIAGSKTVSIVPQLRGQPATGYWQAGVTAEPTAVQIVGDPNVLDEVTAIVTADVDITGAIGDLVRTVMLVRPSGISLVRDQAATVRVGIQPLQGQQVRDVAVSVANVGSDLVAEMSPPVVTITLAGPQPALIALVGQDLGATADAKGLDAGSHQLPLALSLPANVRILRTAPDQVTVTLKRSG